MDSENIICPFCGEDGFDLPGLKYHITYYCQSFEETKTLKRRGSLSTRKMEILEEIYKRRT